MRIEYIFKVVGEIDRLRDTKKIQALEEELKSIREFGRFKIVSITFMSQFLVVLVDFEDITKLDRSSEMVIDAFAGAIVYALGCRVRYKLYEVHGVTRSLIYHIDWEKGSYE